MAKSVPAPVAAPKSLAVDDLPIGALQSTPIVSSLRWAPYITFAHHSRKDEWAKLNAKFGANKVQEGAPFYVDGDDVRDLSGGMKLGYVCGTQYWAHKDPSGKLLAFSRSPKPDPFREAVEAVLLVYLEEKVAPANVTFHTTKCGAAKAMSEALALASTADWGKQGPSYEATMAVKQPFLRFYADVVLSAPRNSKKTGLPYTTLLTTVVPTGRREWDQLKALGADANVKNLLEMAAERYQSVIKELEAKEVK